MEMQRSVYVITGANKGLGLSFVKEAIQRNGTVEAISKSPQSSSLSFECNFDFTQLDCSDAVATGVFWVALSRKCHSDTDVILINNAGTYYKGLLTETDPATYLQLIKDNYLSAVNMTKGFVTNFKKGTIVNIISTGALRNKAGGSGYGSAKAAEASFFSALRDEFKSTNFRIMNIYAGSINTWSPNPEPGCIKPDELAKWILDTAIMKGTFEIADCTLLPFSE
ncbi:MAG: SDR family NAD(P)-dependent oxidoreductase [Nitrospirae bacterium]|nr:SDR family NAD(P)-dependent oxidoreductase [Nitrospirota bacterium]